MTSLRRSPSTSGSALRIAARHRTNGVFHAPTVDPLTTDAGCYVRVVDADTLYLEWQEVGLVEAPATGSRLVPPSDTAYGMREFALVDPSGNLVRVGSPLL
jgi:hypothetical protein